MGIDGAAFQAVNRVFSQQSFNDFIEVAAVLLPEHFQIVVDLVRLELPFLRGCNVDRVDVFQGSSCQHGETHVIALCDSRINVLGVLSSSQGVFKLLGRQEDILLGIAGEFVEVCFFSWKGAGADELYESIIVDQDAAGVEVAYFLVVLLELRASPHHRVEQVPQLCLQEVPFDSPSVLDLFLEHVRVMRISELKYCDPYLDNSAGAAHPGGLEDSFGGQKEDFVGDGVIDLVMLLHPPIKDCLRLHCPSDHHLLHRVALLICALDELHFSQALVLLAVRGLL